MSEVCQNGIDGVLPAWCVEYNLTPEWILQMVVYDGGSLPQNESNPIFKIYFSLLIITSPVCLLKAK